MKTKHPILLGICLLLLIVGILFLFTALMNQTSPKDMEDIDYYNNYYIYDDLPVLKATSAAYLLDLDFTVTPDNFADCMDDYFSAPAMLYFMHYPTSSWYRAMNNSEKASAFSAVFQDISFQSISQEEYPDYKHYEDQYDILNAIGTLRLCLWQGETYISFYRPGHLDEDKTTYFRAEGDLISECISVAESLKDDSVEARGFVVPH